MSTIIDDVREHGLSDKLGGSMTAERREMFTDTILNTVHVFDVTSVFDGMDVGTALEMDLGSLNLMPPYRQFFMQTSKMLRDSQAKTITRRYGVVFWSEQFETQAACRTFLIEVCRVRTQDIRRDIPDRSCVLVGFSYLQWYTGKISADMGQLLMLIDHMGKEVSTFYTINDKAGLTSDMEGAAMKTMFAPFLHAISLLNCDNVRKVEHVPDPKLQRARVRRKKAPLVTYHTLVIDPLRPRTVRVPSEPTDEHMPLHTVRGHFADYRDGGGLFGKYHGVYWIPAHVAGRKEEGVALKDYAIAPG